MDTVLGGLNCTFAYNDVVISSRSKAEHMVHLWQVFERLQQQGLVINLAKCRQELDFLGHHITKHGATPLPAKVTAIREFARPSTVKGLPHSLLPRWQILGQLGSSATSQRYLSTYNTTCIKHIATKWLMRYLVPSSTLCINQGQGYRLHSQPWLQLSRTTRRWQHTAQP